MSVIVPASKVWKVELVFVHLEQKRSLTSVYVQRFSDYLRHHLEKLDFSLSLSGFNLFYY